MDCFREKDALRLFAAVIPGGDVVQAMIDRLAPYRKEAWAKQVRWLPPENIHMTLRFFGDTPKDQYERLVAALSESVQGRGAIGLAFSAMICLPHPSKTRVIAASVTPCSALDDLAMHVENVAGTCGYEPERKRFLGHVTLGRCKNLDLRRQKNLCDFSNLCMTVERIALVQSTLTPKGAVYQSLTTFELLT